MDYKDLEQIGKLYNHIKKNFIEPPTTTQKATLTLENDEEIRAYAIYFGSGRVKFVSARDFSEVSNVAAVSIGVWFNSAK